MAVTKDTKRRTPHVIKAATFLLVAGFLLFSGCASFNAKQTALQKRYWDNVLRREFERSSGTHNAFHYWHYKRYIPK